MSTNAAAYQAAPRGGVVVPIRSELSVVDSRAGDTIKDSSSSEWRPMMPAELFNGDYHAEDIAVYGSLCCFVNRATGECWPSHEAIGKRVKLSRNTVAKAISRLERSGLVLITNQDDRGMKRSNLYFLPHQKTANVQMPTKSASLPTGSATMPTPCAADAQEMGTRCSPDVHESNVIEPTKDESDKGDTPLTPQSKTKAPAELFVDGFDEFYTAYPKHKAKDDAIKAWSRLKPDDKLRRLILDDITTRRQTDEWTKQRGQFVPNPATYLNGKRWTDDMGTVPEATASANGKPVFDDVFAEGIRRAKAKMNGAAVDGDVFETTGTVVH